MKEIKEKKIVIFEYGWYDEPDITKQELDKIKDVKLLRKSWTKAVKNKDGKEVYFYWNGVEKIETSEGVFYINEDGIFWDMQGDREKAQIIAKVLQHYRSDRITKNLKEWFENPMIKNAFSIIFQEG